MQAFLIVPELSPSDQYPLVVVNKLMFPETRVDREDVVSTFLEQLPEAHKCRERCK
jgi:hypothetical protein